MSADSEEAGADSDSRLRILLPIVLLGTIIGGAIDLVLDAPETLWSAHALFEIVLIAAALGTFSLLWRGWWRASRSLGETLEQLAARQRERDA